MKIYLSYSYNSLISEMDYGIKSFQNRFSFLTSVKLHLLEDSSDENTKEGYL